MSPFWKKWWFWVLSAAVLLTLPFAIRYSKAVDPLPSDGPRCESGTLTDGAADAPTEKPSEKPAEIPTEKPTEKPTEAPTEGHTEAPAQLPTETPTEGTPEDVTYILNTNTKKFHLPDCESAAQIKDKNRQEYTGTREELIEEGYSPCKICNP